MIQMPSGGHARSGPPPDEGSARSDARGYRLTALPAEGYRGAIPEWPIEPKVTKVEQAYWDRAWRTPQACVWSRQEWAWLIPDVARYVRLAVRCDEPDANAALLARLPGAKDEVGMTAAGLARMGAKISVNEVADKAAENAAAAATSDSASPKRERRLRKVAGDAQ